MLRVGPGRELPRRPPDNLRAPVHVQLALPMVRLDARGRGRGLHADRRRRDGEEDPRPRGRPSVRRPGDSEPVLDRRRTVAPGRVDRPRDRTPSRDLRPFDRDRRRDRPDDVRRARPGRTGVRPRPIRDGREVPRVRDGRQQGVREPRTLAGARRGEVRPPRSRGLRLRESRPLEGRHKGSDGPLLSRDAGAPSLARTGSWTARVMDPRGAPARSAPAPAAQAHLARSRARSLIRGLAWSPSTAPRYRRTFIFECLGLPVRYEEIEHTADVGIRAYGSTLNELFANAAEGMFSLIADLDSVKEVGEIEVRLEADDIPTLLLRWLSELLYLHETQRLLFTSFDVQVDGTSLRGRARGEAIDKTRHELKLVIKAVTRHRLTVDPQKGIAEVIFDI